MNERERIEAMLAAAADGTISDADRAVLDAYLTLHADDRQALADQRRVVAAMASDAPPAVASTEWDRRWDAIAGEIAGGAEASGGATRTFRIRWPIWLPTAMAAAIGLAVIWWVTAGPMTAATAAPFELAGANEATIDNLVVEDASATCMIMQPSEDSAAVIWITSENGQEDAF